MKYIMMIFVFGLISCADNSNNNQTHYYSMTWSCGNNSVCANHMKAWSGNGSFTSESDCLVWETAFINNYYSSSVTSCTYN